MFVVSCFELGTKLVLEKLQVSIHCVPFKNSYSVGTGAKITIKDMLQTDNGYFWFEGSSLHKGRDSIAKRKRQSVSMQQRDKTFFEVLEIKQGKNRIKNRQIGTQGQ